jgi:hypothetical protein
MNLTRMLVCVKGRAKLKHSLTFCVFEIQGISVFHPLPSPSHSLDKTSLRMASLSTHLALPQAACCHIETMPKFFVAEHSWCDTSIFHSIRHTLVAQVSCLHVGPNFAVGKELFNENYLHIIFHPFYTQHCVGKTWRGWGPKLLVGWASHHISSTNKLH